MNSDLIHGFPGPAARARLIEYCHRSGWPPDLAGRAGQFLRRLAQAECRCPVNPNHLLVQTPIFQSLDLLCDPAAAWLLRFPAASGVSELAFELVPEFVAVQLDEYFPSFFKVMPAAGLPLAGPAELKDLTAFHFEDVKTGAHGAHTGVYHLFFRTGRRVILKRTDMTFERLAASLLEEVLGLPAVEIIWTSSAFSIMKPVEGLSLREISGNPLGEPRLKKWPEPDLLAVARVLGEEAALAYCLHLFSRHSGNLLARQPGGLASSAFVRIDFGQSLLAVRNPVLESFMPLWHLRRFFPAEGQGFYEHPPVFRAIGAGFAGVAETAWQKRAAIVERLDAAAGLPLPEMAAETKETRIQPADVRRVAGALAAGAAAGETFNWLYNQFYRTGWQIGGWEEYRPPRDRAFTVRNDELMDLLEDRCWL